MTQTVAPIWARDAKGQTLLVTAGRPWQFGTARHCDFRFAGDGEEVWFVLQHAAVWSVRPGSECVRVLMGGDQLPYGRATALPIEQSAVTIRVERAGQAFAVELTPSEPRIGGRSPDRRRPTIALTGWETPQGRTLRVGRFGGGAEIQLTGFDVAEHHLDVEWVDNVLHVTDRSRGLGVHVEGRPVLHTRLRPGSTFVVGHHLLEVGDHRLLLRPLRTGMPALVIDGLTAQYSGRDGTRDGPVLSDLSFTVGERSLVAVLGPSGAGKSSLGRVLLGEMRKVVGAVQFMGVDLKRRHSLWHLISFVPQAESLPLELTVQRSLGFVARLRLPADLSVTDRDSRVRQVLESVELQAHQGKRIDELSGGQRRRVSVAMELLSDPLLLVLDEPTSGLDEGLDQRMMQTLRLLAEHGTSVLLITHNTANLDLADAALALTGTGKVGYFGPPQLLKGAFGATSYADVMNELRSGHGAAQAAQPPATAVGATSRPVRRPHDAMRVMLSREAARARTRRAWLALNLFVAPLIIALLAVVAGNDGLRAPGGPGTGRPATVLSVLVICVAFTATQVSFTSLVSDRNLILREARWGLTAGPVIRSRAVLGSAIALWQAVTACLLFLLLRPAPSISRVLPAGAELIVSMMLLALASCALGLAISAAAASLEKAVFALMGVSVFQVVLCGLVIPFADPHSAGERAFGYLSTIVPTRWGAAAIAASIDLGRPPASAGQDQSRALPRPAIDSLWAHNATQVWTAWAVLVAMCLLFLLVARSLLAHATHKRV
jgi:ABC transport system ATP-binding/permease protein